MIEKLRNCKCGNTPNVVKVGDRKTLFVVKCNKCGLILANYHEASNLPTGAIRLWNNRVPEII